MITAGRFQVLSGGFFLGRLTDYPLPHIFGAGVVIVLAEGGLVGAGSDLGVDALSARLLEVIGDFYVLCLFIHLHVVGVIGLELHRRPVLHGHPHFVEGLHPHSLWRIGGKLHVLEGLEVGVSWNLEGFFSHIYFSL